MKCCTLDAQMDADVIGLLSSYENEIEYGPELSHKISNGFVNAVTKLPTKEISDAVKERAKIPVNCKQMCVPKVNPEIWANIPVRARVVDVKAQQLQQHLSIALVNMSRIANIVIERSKDLPSDFTKEIVRHSMDGAMALGVAQQELSMKRRLDIKPHLNSDYSGICSNRIPVSEFLFGDDLSESLKTSKTTSDLIKKTGHKFIGTNNRTRPYSRNQNQRPHFSGNLNFNRPSFSNFRRGGGSFRGQRFSTPNQFKRQ